MTSAYGQHGNKFTGKIAKITINVDAAQMTPGEAKAADAADEAIAVSTE